MDNQVKRFPVCYNCREQSDNFNELYINNPQGTQIQMNGSKNLTCRQMQLMDSILPFTSHSSTTLKSSLQREIRKDGVHFKTETSENQHNTATKYSIFKALINKSSTGQNTGVAKPSSHFRINKKDYVQYMYAGITKTSTATLEVIKHIRDVNTCEARKTSNTTWQVQE